MFCKLYDVVSYSILHGNPQSVCQITSKAIFFQLFYFKSGTTVQSQRKTDSKKKIIKKHAFGKKQHSNCVCSKNVSAKQGK